MTAANECPKSPHGWTLDTLEEYLSSKVEGIRTYFADLRILDKESVTTAMIAAEKAIAAAMTASEKAILKAEMAAEKRSEASNEIRAAMIDQQRNFADKPQTEFRFGALDIRIEELKTNLTKRLDGIDQSIFVSSGQKQGSNMLAYTVFLGLTVLCSIGTLIFVVSTHAH